MFIQCKLIGCVQKKPKYATFWIWYCEYMMRDKSSPVVVYSLSEAVVWSCFTLLCLAFEVDWPVVIWLLHSSSLLPIPLNRKQQLYTLALKSHPIMGLLKECQSCFCEAIIAYMLTVCNMTIEIIWQTGPDEHTVPFTPRGACHLVWPVEFWHQMSPAGTAADICSHLCVRVCSRVCSLAVSISPSVYFCLIAFVFSFPIPSLLFLFHNAVLCWCILSINRASLHSAILPMIL